MKINFKEGFEKCWNYRKYWFVIFFIAIVIPVHELLHYFICFLTGSRGELHITFSRNYVDCPQIVNKSKILQCTYQTMPYIFDMTIILIFLFVNIKRTFLHTVPYAAIFDIFGNYLLTIFQTTDFQNIFLNSVYCRNFSILIVSISVGGVFIYFMKKDYPIIKNFILKILKKLRKMY